MFTVVKFDRAYIVQLFDSSQSMFTLFELVREIISQLADFTQLTSMFSWLRA